MLGRSVQQRDVETSGISRVVKINFPGNRNGALVNRGRNV
jgi:hypothetical protein